MNARYISEEYKKGVDVFLQFARQNENPINERYFFLTFII